MTFNILNNVFKGKAIASNYRKYSRQQRNKGNDLPQNKNIPTDFSKFIGEP